jgi:hypothetical protein
MPGGIRKLREHFEAIEGVLDRAPGKLKAINAEAERINKTTEKNEPIPLVTHNLDPIGSLLSNRTNRGSGSGSAVSSGSVSSSGGSGAIARQFPNGLFDANGRFRLFDVPVFDGVGINRGNARGSSSVSTGGGQTSDIFGSRDRQEFRRNNPRTVIPPWMNQTNIMQRNMGRVGIIDDNKSLQNVIIDGNTEIVRSIGRLETAVRGSSSEFRRRS